MTGRPAQFGRGMIADVGAKLIGQFADCLADTLAEKQPEPAPAESEPEPAPAESEPAVAIPPVRVAQPVPAEPIDLLRLTGSTASARRPPGYAVGAVALAALAWATVRWLSR